MGEIGEMGERVIREEKFIDIGSCGIRVLPYYYKHNFRNSVDKMYAREEVVRRLLKVEMELSRRYGLHIVVLDAWRPYKLQEELYYRYSNIIIENMGVEFISKFVSKPEWTDTYQPVHTTGGAVDLTLCDNSGVLLNMGSDFDEFSDRAYTDYYDDKKDTVEYMNRQLLLNIMQKNGFTNLESEWWHYDFGDSMWEERKRVKRKRVYRRYKGVKQLDLSNTK